MLNRCRCGRDLVIALLGIHLVLVNLFAVEKVLKDLMALLVKLFLDEPFESFSWKSSLLVAVLVLLPVSMPSLLFLSFSWSRIETLIGRGTVAHVLIVRVLFSSVVLVGADDFIESSFDVGAVDLHFTIVCWLSLDLSLLDGFWLDHLLVCRNSISCHST